jgi:hypothetical protein
LERSTVRTLTCAPGRVDSVLSVVDDDLVGELHDVDSVLHEVSDQGHRRAAANRRDISWAKVFSSPTISAGIWVLL